MVRLRSVTYWRALEMILRCLKVEKACWMSRAAVFCCYEGVVWVGGLSLFTLVLGLLMFCNLFNLTVL